MAQPPREARPLKPTVLVALAALLPVVVTGLIVGLLDRASARPQAAAESVQVRPTAEQSPAAAVGRAPEGSAEPAAWPDAALDVTLKLLAVLALIYVSLALLRRYSEAGFAKRAGLVEVLDSTSLGPNRTIYLIRVRRKQILIGATPTQITALASWESGAASAELPSLDPEAEALVKAFSGRPR